MLKQEECWLGQRLLASRRTFEFGIQSNYLIGTFNFLLSAEGACMSTNDDSNLPEVERVPLVIDAEFTEEEESFDSLDNFSQSSTQKTHFISRQSFRRRGRFKIPVFTEVATRR